jgi:hypothetical protein
MSVIVTTNAVQVAAGMGRISGTTLIALGEVIDTAAVELRDEWRANATQTAGVHGKRYPASINYKMFRSFGVIGADIEPNEGMAQGGMSFEFGSRNQPPHLDGQRAADRYAPLIARRIEQVLAFT